MSHSFLRPEGTRSSSCGYCTPPGSGIRSAHYSSSSTGAYALSLSPHVYQSMIDRGWRRSGTYCYKPDLPRSCCPQYTTATVRLDASQFTPSKSQRKLVNRWNRYVQHGDDKEDDIDAEATQPDSQPSTSRPQQGKSSRNNGGPFSFPTTLHGSEHAYLSSSDEKQSYKHRFEVSLEPSSFTEEKYALFESYQLEIHNDVASPGGFERFLCDTPIVETPIPYPAGTTPPAHLPETYGSYHQMYRVDGELIAVGVLDILPGCVSSVYFLYDRRWERFSLGKLSAMREAALAREIYEAGVPDTHWLYMGFYIYSCQKMRYKGDYAPSDLLDPETFEWYPLKNCIPMLQKNRYACFSSPAHSVTAIDKSKSIPAISEAVINEKARIVESITAQMITVSRPKDSKVWRSKWTRQSVIATVSALGEKLTGEVLLVCD